MLHRNLRSKLLMTSRPYTSLAHRPLSAVSRMIAIGFGVCTLTAGVKTYAQPPAPDNYAAISVGEDAQVVAGVLNRSDSNSVVGVYDGGFAAIGYLSSRILLPKFPGDTSSYRAYAADGSLVVGERENFNDPTYSNRNKALAYDGSTLIDLHLLARQQLGFSQPGLFTEAFGVQGNTIVGYASVSSGSQPGGSPWFTHALRWQKTAAGYVTTDLHQAANLDTVFGPGATSTIMDISGNALIGFAGAANIGNHALRLDAVGAGFSVADLHPQALLGTDSESLGKGIDGSLSVGYGYGALTGVRPLASPSSFYYLRYYHNAFAWQGTTPTNLHQATNLNTVLGADADSGAVSVAGNVIVGYGNGSNYGTLNSNSNGYPFKYNFHALRWTMETNGTVTLLDLHRFLPKEANFSMIGNYSGVGKYITADGTIVGRYRNTNEVDAIEDHPVYWKPLVPGTGISVPLRSTTYVTKAFVQTAGNTKIGGILDLTKGAYGPVTYTLSGGNLSGSGLIRGTVSNTGGTFAPPLKPLPQSGPIIYPTPAYTPLIIQGNYSQGRNGQMLLGLSSKGTGFVQINGSASLQGTLALSSSGGTPTYGASFQFAEVTGTATVAFSSVPAGWTVSAVKGTGFPAATKLYLVYTRR